MTALRKQVRHQRGREEQPGAVIIESLSITTSPVRETARDFDDGTYLSGRQRHPLVETLGLLLAVTVHATGLADRCGDPLLLHGLTGRFTRFSHLFAERASTGSLIEWMKEYLGRDVDRVPKPERRAIKDGEIVGLPGPTDGFQIQRHCWICERTPGWFIRSRRLARDDEGLPSSSEAFIQIASIQLFFTRLPGPCRFDTLEGIGV